MKKQIILTVVLGVAFLGGSFLGERTKDVKAELSQPASEVNQSILPYQEIASDKLNQTEEILPKETNDSEVLNELNPSTDTKESNVIEQTAEVNSQVSELTSSVENIDETNDVKELESNAETTDMKNEVKSEEKKVDYSHINDGETTERVIDGDNVIVHVYENKQAGYYDVIVEPKNGSTTELEAGDETGYYIVGSTPERKEVLNKITQ